MKLLKTLEEGFTLMVSLPKNDPDMAKAAVDAGAKCLKVHINCHHFASDTRFGTWDEEKSVIAEIKDAIGDIPLGIVTGESSQPGIADLSAITKSGIDFWDLFCRYTPPQFLELPKLGKMVAIDSTWEPWLVQGLGKLGVDVIESSIVPRDFYRTPLNLEDLCRYQRLAECSPIPILIPTQKAIKPDEVTHLKNVGAAGITIGAVVTGIELKSLADKTAEFAEAISYLG